MCVGEWNLNTGGNFHSGFKCSIRTSCVVLGRSAIPWTCLVWFFVCLARIIMLLWGLREFMWKYTPLEGCSCELKSLWGIQDPLHAAVGASELWSCVQNTFWILSGPAKRAWFFLCPLVFLLLVWWVGYLCIWPSCFPEIVTLPAFFPVGTEIAS